ncbi:MAG: type II secretion system-associated lipoprotein [Leptospiraceae bacterium]|nr:type II secretion system-associated lipoprotein [Leptospiraceae bacterium]MDW7975727.1 type II secretion system-associated lipoprotein [Leptospiraceae bacterium]
MKFFQFLLMFFLVYWVFFCRTTLVSKKELQNWNQDYQKHVYLTTSEVFLSDYDFETNSFVKVQDQPLIQKNSKVTLKIEAVDDWVRLRVFEENKNRIDYFGVVVLYLHPADEKKKSKELKKIIDEYIETHFKKL